MQKVELLIIDYTCEGDIFENQSFVDIIYTLCVDTLPKVGCDAHYIDVMTNIVYDYMLLRFSFVAKQTALELCEKSYTKKHKNSKLSKAV